MCSLVDGAFIPVEDDDSASVGTVSSSTTDSALCKKCKVAEPNLTLRKKDNYCAQCFLSSSKHKFRATLGKHKIMKIDEKVLVSFQGKYERISFACIKRFLDFERPHNVRDM